MGSVCARCAELQKSDAGSLSSLPLAAELDDLENSDGESAGGNSEVAASSSGDEVRKAGYKREVEETLGKVARTLKRGKTMAMREVISMAKKFNLDALKITEAEKLLDDHKRQQRIQEVESEVQAFFLSQASRTIPVCETLLRKAAEAGVGATVTQRLKEHLDELVITRYLEEEEVSRARKYLKDTCREFVEAATSGQGRPVVFVDLDDGRKASAYLSIDPPLQHFRLIHSGAGEEEQVTPIACTRPIQAQADGSVKGSRGFLKLDESDANCAVALRYSFESYSGVWCFVEPTQLRRDELVEAIVMLKVTCVANLGR